MGYRRLMSPPFTAASSARRVSLPRIPRTGGLASALACVLLIAPGAAQAADKSAVSAPTGMQVTLSGANLTFSAGEKASSTFLREVQGHRVIVACAAGVESLLELTVAAEQAADLPTGTFDASVLGGFVDWPAGATSMSYTLPRDVSEQVDGCLVGRELTATFGFGAQAQKLLVESVGEEKLALAFGAAQAVARERQNRSFPAARRLVAAIAAREPQLTIAYAPSVRAARRDDVIYVIGAGTSQRKLRLAHRRNGELPAVSTGGRRGQAEVDVPRDSETPLGGRVGIDKTVGRL